MVVVPRSPGNGGYGLGARVVGTRPPLGSGTGRGPGYRGPGNGCACMGIAAASSSITAIAAGM